MVVVLKAARAHYITTCPKRPRTTIEKLNQRYRINDRHCHVQQLWTQIAVDSNIESEQEMSHNQKLHPKIWQTRKEPQKTISDFSGQNCTVRIFCYQIWTQLKGSKSVLFWLDDDLIKDAL